MKIFSVRLRELRKEEQLSQRQVAEKLNIRQQSYAQYENDISEPSLSMLVQIAKLFDVTTDYLVGMDEL